MIKKVLCLIPTLGMKAIIHTILEKTGWYGIGKGAIRSLAEVHLEKLWRGSWVEYVERRRFAITTRPRIVINIGKIRYDWASIDKKFGLIPFLLFSLSHESLHAVMKENGLITASVFLDKIGIRKIEDAPQDLTPYYDGLLLPELFKDDYQQNE